MLDDLRNSAAQSFPENENPQGSYEEPSGERPAKKKQFLGMTAAQRFVLALLLLFVTCMGGVLCLLVTGSIYFQ